MHQPGLLWSAAEKYARFVFLTRYFVAQDQQRPARNKGDFFGDTTARNNPNPRLVNPLQKILETFFLSS